MKITVTQEHIAQGKRQSRCACPIALAIKDTCGQDCDPRVSDMYIYIAKDTERYYVTPWQAKAFISIFDSGGIPNPIELELEPFARFA